MNNNYFYKYFSTKKDYPNLNKLFNIQAQLDDTNTSEAIIDAIEESKDLFIEKAKISVKYSFYNLDKINADNIIVSDDTASSYIFNRKSSSINIKRLSSGYTIHAYFKWL